MPPSSKTLRVLIADDQAINRKLTSRRLERLGFVADSVESGLEALEALSRVPYDLVFMDCHMPQMDGFRATEEIRRREGTARHTPIVALTASAVGPERDRCIAVGMDDYVTKPITDADLNRLLRQWVVDGRPAIDSATTTVLQQIGEGDENILHEVIDLYFADAPARMDTIRNAIAARDSESLTSAAHALKSSSGNVGATRVCEICGELEVIGRGGVADGADKLLAQLESEYERASGELREMRRA
jgi:two-component system sensor histidine kinase/response regulator